MPALAEAVLAIALGGGGFAFVRRFGGGTALAELERANRVLERRVHELETENKGQSVRIAELQAKTDVAIALAPVLSALERHETAAEIRSNAMLHVLDLIAARLGPDGNGSS